MTKGQAKEGDSDLTPSHTMAGHWLVLSTKRTVLAHPSLGSLVFKMRIMVIPPSQDSIKECIASVWLLIRRAQ